MNVIDKLTEAIQILDEIDNYKDELPNKQSNVDYKISDLLHYIENNNLSAPQSCKIIKELKVVRLERRQIKQDQTLLDAYTKHINKLINQGNRQMLLAELHKAEKSLGKKYKNRVYTEDNINELLGIRS